MIEETSIPSTPDARWAWREDVRFFLTCYAAGLLFFLVMLS